MKRKALIALIISSCVVVVGCVGLVFWAFAATQVTVKSSLVVSYKPTPQVVCETSATYQKTTDATATPFQTGNLEFVYGGPDTTRNIEASSDALQLDDTDTYVVFEFTFQNKNLMENYELTITLTDNGTVSNMTRKYYFGDLSSSNISAKRTTIKNSGIDNSSLSSKKLVLGYQETGRIYMLLEITSGTVASYLADNTNKFVFTLTTAEHLEAYLTRNWTSRIGDNTSLGTVTKSIIFTNDSSKISGLTNSVSVGTNSPTSTAAYTPATGVVDVLAYWGSNKSTIVIYSPGIIFAPQDSNSLFTVGLSSSSSGSLSKLTKLDLTNFDTSNVTMMYYMFSYCKSLTSLDVSNFDTSKVTYMQSMFSDCSSLTSLDVSNFDTSNVKNMQYMFSYCKSLTSLDVSNFDTSNVTNMAGMFSNCSSLTSLDLTNFDTSKVTSMQFMFSNCSSLTSLDLSNFNTSKVSLMQDMFNYCSSLTSLDLSSFNTSKVTDMMNMFNNCSKLTSLNLGNFDTSKVTSMQQMFSSCSKLISLDVSNFDTSIVTSMSYMFYYCRSLTSLDVSNFDTSKVTTMQSMFIGCTSLTSLDLGNFNLASCTNFGNMLTSCSALASITLPYNLQSGYTISLPTSTYYHGSAGPYSTIGTATSGTTVACSTASNKVTLTKQS